MFDRRERIRRRDRAAQKGPALFLADRVFADIVDSIETIDRHWEDALLIGAPAKIFVARLAEIAGRVRALEPSPLLAARSGAEAIDEAALPTTLEPASLDLIVAMGTLDTVDDLPAVLFALAAALRPGGMIIGVLPGADTLPRLRHSMRAADAISGEAVAHVHPRVDASALAGLLTAAGLADPVVEVDRVQAAYASLDRLVDDLRAMGATNILIDRPRGYIGEAGWAAARASFVAGHEGEKAVETFELLHFAAWRPETARKYSPD